MITLTILAGVAGLALLVKGADSFVAGAAAAASKRRISPALVGALILGLGTSAPEIVVSGRAAAAGSPALAIGNVLGSNVANLTLVLGAASLIAATVASRRVLRVELVLAVAGTGAFVWAIQGGLTRIEGALLTVGLVGAVAYMIAAGNSPDETPAATPDSGPIRADVVRLVAGLAGVLVGAELAVRAAVAVAGTFGLGEGFVGMTIVAVGTSLPEMATAISSARRGQMEMLAGNLLGSNVFNVLAVGGLVGLTAPGPINDAALTTVGVAVVLATTALAAAFLLVRGQITRRSGAVLVACWIASVPLLA